MKKSNFINLLLCVFLKLIIEFIYYQILIVRYDYMGITLSYDFVKHIESYLLLFAIYFLMDKSKDKASAIFLQIIFVLSIIPLLAIYGLKDESRMALYLSVGSFALTAAFVRKFPKIESPLKFLMGITMVVIAYGIFTGSVLGFYAALGVLGFLIVTSRMLSGIEIPRFRYSKVISFSVLALISLVTYILVINENGFPSLSAFNFDLIYDVRREVIHSAFTRYLIPWQANVVNIFLIAIFYIKKNYFKMLIPVMMQLLLFAITAQKLYLFSPFVVIGLFFIFDHFNLLRTIISGLIFLNITGCILYVTNINVWPLAIVTHRLTFMPAQIGFYYFDFFSKNEILNFSEGFIGKVFRLESPYPMKIFNLIGEQYFNNSDMNTNTWYVADAYSNGGIYGLLVISLVFAITLIIIDSITKNYKISVAALLIPVLSLTNISLLTSFFTSGLLVGIILIAVNSDVIDLNRIGHRISLLINVRQESSIKQIRKID